MTHAAFLSAVLALLLAPGPTNTLMGIAGAQGDGARSAARLIPAELLGYLSAILPLGFLGSVVLEQWPAAGVIIRLAAAVWVLFLAVRMWGAQGQGKASARPGAGGIYLTTLLNPKALVFALVLLSTPDNALFWPRLGLFCGAVIAAALVWFSLGTLLCAGSGRARRLPLVQRVAAGWLAMVSVMLVAGVLRA